MHKNSIHKIKICSACAAYLHYNFIHPFHALAHGINCFRSICLWNEKKNRNMEIIHTNFFIIREINNKMQLAIVLWWWCGGGVVVVVVVFLFARTNILWIACDEQFCASSIGPIRVLFQLPVWEYEYNYRYSISPDTVLHRQGPNVNGPTNKLQLNECNINHSNNDDNAEQWKTIVFAGFFSTLFATLFTLHSLTLSLATSFMPSIFCSYLFYKLLNYY